LKYEVIWGHIDILVVAVRRLSRRWKVKTLLAGSSPTSPMRRRLPTPLFPTGLTCLMPLTVAGATVSSAITDATLFSGGAQARKPAKMYIRAHIHSTGLTIVSVVRYFRISTVRFTTEEHLGILQLQSK